MEVPGSQTFGEVKDTIPERKWPCISKFRGENPSAEDGLRKILGG